jgi:hypothetical protein
VNRESSVTWAGLERVVAVSHTLFKTRDFPPMASPCEVLMAEFLATLRGSGSDSRQLVVELARNTS